MREAGVGCIWTVLVPGLQIIESRWLSPPIAPGHGIFTHPEECAFAYSLEEYGKVKSFVLCIEVDTIAVARRRGTCIFYVAITAWLVIVQADLSITIQVFETSIADGDVVGYAFQLFIIVQLFLVPDHSVELISEIAVDGIAFAVLV